MEQADGIFAVAPPSLYLLWPTLLGVNTVCKLRNIMFVDDQKIICVGSDASTRASLTRELDNMKPYYRIV